MSQDPNREQRPTTYWQDPGASGQQCNYPVWYQAGAAGYQPGYGAAEESPVWQQPPWHQSPLHQHPFPQPSHHWPQPSYQQPPYRPNNATDERRANPTHRPGANRSDDRSDSSRRRDADSKRKHAGDERYTSRDHDRHRLQQSRIRDDVRSRERRRDQDRSDSDRGRDRQPDKEERTGSYSRRDRAQVPDTIAPNSPECTEMSELFTRQVSWVRCFPAEPFYTSGPENEVRASDKLLELQQRFKTDLLERNARNRRSRTPFELPARSLQFKCHHHHHEQGDGSGSDICCSSDSDTNDEKEEDVTDTVLEELERKKAHPWRLNDELWYNEKGEMNDGPLCRCSLRARKSGIRHGIYPGEEHTVACDPNTNNTGRLFHYRIVVVPLTNYCSKFPTTVPYDGHNYVFEGFSILAHSKITDYPPCKLIRFNIEYTITVQEEKFPVHFTVKDLDMMTDYLFEEILELVDISWKANEDSTGCPRFHLFPRFARLIEEDGKELLSPAVVVQYLLNSSTELCDFQTRAKLPQMKDSEWQDFARRVKGMITVHPGSKPCAIRIDQIDREDDEVSSERDAGRKAQLVIVHFGIRPPQLSYAGNPKYQRAWRDYVKFRHLLANKPKVSMSDRQTLLQKEEKLQELRLKSDLKRDVTVVVPAEGFVRTGIFCDVTQFALMIPVLVCHLRFHQSLTCLEQAIGYSFADRFLLQLALTHPSYRENFGTNPDHARNTLTNCGMRQPHYGDRKVHYQHTRKRGINMLIDIMSRFGRERETTSSINHNERLEFLGDAVVEFLSSIHLYFMFPDLEEGGLATYRAAIVQNQHLAVLAKKLHLERFMLYAHGSDLCHDLELRHAMANCFEALMGALFLDAGIQVTDRVFSNTLFADNPKLLDVWVNYPKHPIVRQEPDGDRAYIQRFPRLQQLVEFEKLSGIKFTHIRLLARAFTHRSVGFNNLTLGSNQRMEFLGDTVLQLVASEYLYKFFPEHHEGHLSLLRSSLVNNKTQAVVCDDLGMTDFASYNYAKGELKHKDRADLLEAFLGALYVDKGLPHCIKFCEVCFFPRLEQFIMNQDWNDPKSKLQQCCLTLRSVDGGDPDIPVYKVTECLGPTNTREYVVAVRFRDKRLATGKGHSIQEAEMNAAANALEASEELFPQLNRQKQVIERSVKSGRYLRPDTHRRNRETSPEPIA